MREATRLLVASYEELISGYEDTIKNLKSLRSLAGKPSQRRSYNRLKELGITLILTPTPEPLSDVIGISILGIAKFLETHSSPLTLCDLAEESRTIFRNLRVMP